MTNDQVWQAVLGELELSISKANFTTWFAKTSIISTEQGEATIGVPNDFTKNWLENKYHKQIIKAIQRVTNNAVTSLTYQIETLRKAASARAVRVPQPATPSDASELSPRYTFETFIVGKGSELAHAASQAIVKKPGLTYNPLFIYGGTGLGKTHLMHAIGHAYQERHVNERVVYVTCERFTNDFVQAVRSGGRDQFKQHYRGADILLVDDIQFLGGKEGTQEEFFHTFNNLYHAKKQIVISCDRPPKSIPSLESRLTSRFEWGLIADITKPDLETRRAILTAKCQEKNFSLPDDVLAFIATTIQSNIRELEGALNRVIAHCELKQIQITAADAKDLLASILHQPDRTSLSPQQLVETVAQFYEISKEDLRGSSRRKELVTPRQIAMYLMREELKSSYPNIGQVLGGRDHTTAMHAYSKIARQLTNDDKIKQDIEYIKQRLRTD